MQLDNSAGPVQTTRLLDRDHLLTVAICRRKIVAVSLGGGCMLWQVGGVCLTVGAGRVA